MESHRLRVVAQLIRIFEMADTWPMSKPSSHISLLEEVMPAVKLPASRESTCDEMQLSSMSDLETKCLPGTRASTSTRATL